MYVPAVQDVPMNIWDVLTIIVLTFTLLVYFVFFLSNLKWHTTTPVSEWQRVAKVFNKNNAIHNANAKAIATNVFSMHTDDTHIVIVTPVSSLASSTVAEAEACLEAGNVQLHAIEPIATAVEEARAETAHLDAPLVTKRLPSIAVCESKSLAYVESPAEDDNNHSTCACTCEHIWGCELHRVYPIGSLLLRRKSKSQAASVPPGLDFSPPGLDVVLAQRLMPLKKLHQNLRS